MAPDDDYDFGTICKHCGVRSAVTVDSNGRATCASCLDDYDAPFELPDEPPPGWCGDDEP